MTYYAKFRIKEGFRGVLYRVEEGRRVPLCPDSSGMFQVPYNMEFYFVEDLGESIEVELCRCMWVVDFRRWHPWIIPLNCDIKCSMVLIAKRSPMFEDIVNEVYEGVEPCL